MTTQPFVSTPVLGAHASPKLLVSVQNAQEATLALAAGVQWIDLKDPSSGPLGAASSAVMEQVANCLVGHSCKSAALGELADLNPTDAAAAARLFPVLKTGLAGMVNADWERKFISIEQIAAQASPNFSCLVPVVYADASACGAPELDDVLRFVSEQPVPRSERWVLIDTYHKDGRSLLDHWSADQVAGAVVALTLIGARTVLAGSLRAADLSSLGNLPVEALGVRGAACKSGRETAVCPERLAQLVAILTPRKD